MEVNIHLSQGALKYLVPWLIVGEHVTSGTDLQLDPEAVPIARHIESTLRMAANGRLHVANIQEFTIDRIRALHASSDPLVNGPEARAELAEKFSAALSAAKRRTCESCAGETGHQCDGVDLPADERQLNTRGLCVSRITELFNFLEMAVEREYLRAGVQPKSLKISANVVRDARSGESAATATTSFDDDGSQLNSIIQVALRVERMTWDAYSTLPYTIIHELICHVYQGSCSNTGRAISGKQCQFADGWMDYVAFTFFRDLTDTPSEIVRALPTVTHALIAQWIKCGTQRHYERYKETVDIHRYSAGRESAAALERLLRVCGKRCPLPPDSAWPAKKLREFSLALNAVRDNGPTEAAFSACFQTLCRLIEETMVGIPDWERDQALCDAIQAFCVDRDLDSLVKSLRLLLQRFNYLR